ncbi:MAG: DUF547 domain-containing protein [Bacteroidales bacterium]
MKRTADFRRFTQMNVRSGLSATLLALLAALSWGFVVRGTPRIAPEDALHKPLDEILDLYVRDGYVYYRALKADRAKLDRYVVSLDDAATAQIATWPRERQVAFWINAYNAWVLRSVIDHYPIRGSSPEYPSDSLRQVPGVFDRQVRRVAGRTLTLDGIENVVLGAFDDPRVYFALGRAAVGSGRLRSEAFQSATLEDQLKSVAAEVPTRRSLVQMDRTGKRLMVSPIFGWHEAAFVSAYAGKADLSLASRAPIERAIVAFIQPNLTTGERDFLQPPDFQVSYLSFDWHLNDLATRR